MERHITVPISRETAEELRAGDYEPTGGETLYRKKKVPVGYVPAERLFPVGTEIVIRMMEGDTTQTVTHGLCIMIGVDYEIYHTEMATLLKKYDLSEEAYPIESGYPPVVYNAATGEAKPLAAYARQCIPKDTALIRAGRWTAGSRSLLSGGAA